MPDRQGTRTKGERKKKRGGWTQNRTGDTRIFNPLLYQLSYPAGHEGRQCREAIFGPQGFYFPPIFPVFPSVLIPSPAKGG